jgi:hypothetical protein
MASTSTNKQPLLVDRPLHVIADLSERTIADDSNGVDIGGSNSAALIIDCTQNDGAIIDTIYSISRDIQAPITNPYEVFIYLSTANDYLRNNQAFVLGNFRSSVDTMGIVRWAQGPEILRPTPKVGSVNAADDPVDGTYYRGLYIPKGMALWAAVKKQSVSDTGNRAPLLHAQGGYF